MLGAVGLSSTAGPLPRGDAKSNWRLLGISSTLIMYAGGHRYTGLVHLKNSNRMPAQSRERRRPLTRPSQQQLSAAAVFLSCVAAACGGTLAPSGPGSFESLINSTLPSVVDDLALLGYDLSSTPVRVVTVNEWETLQRVLPVSQGGGLDAFLQFEDLIYCAFLDRSPTPIASLRDAWQNQSGANLGFVVTEGPAVYVLPEPLGPLAEGMSPEELEWERSYREDVLEETLRHELVHYWRATNREQRSSTLLETGSWDDYVALHLLEEGEAEIACMALEELKSPERPGMFCAFRDNSRVESFRDFVRFWGGSNPSAGAIHGAPYLYQSWMQGGWGEVRREVDVFSGSTGDLLNGAAGGISGKLHHLEDLVSVPPMIFEEWREVSDAEMGTYFLVSLAERLHPRSIASISLELPARMIEDRIQLLTDGDRVAFVWAQQWRSVAHAVEFREQVKASGFVGALASSGNVSVLGWSDDPEVLAHISNALQLGSFFR